MGHAGLAHGLRELRHRGGVEVYPGKHLRLYVMQRDRERVSGAMMCRRAWKSVLCGLWVGLFATTSFAETRVYSGGNVEVVVTPSATGTHTEATGGANLRFNPKGGVVSVLGDLTVSQLATPGAPTVTPQGTTGATTYGYKIVARTTGGQTAASSEDTTTTGNATLSATDFNRLTWAAIEGANGYDVYRTTGGATQGKINASLVASPTFDDTGLLGSGAAPTTNTTGAFAAVGSGGDVDGPASSVDNSLARFDGTTGKLLQGYTSNAPVCGDTGSCTFSANVGIGASPGTKLHVYDNVGGPAWAGRAAFSGLTAAVIAGQYDNVAIVGAHNAALSLWADLYVNWDGTAGGNVLLKGPVGVGDATPDHKLDVAGNIGLDASGYLNFGDTDGTTGYGLRDNAGAVQFKNSGGAWAGLGGGSTITAATATVSTEETTTSVTYADLATSGPAVTVTIGPSGILLVGIKSLLANTVAGSRTVMGFALSGGNTLAAVDDNAIHFQESVGGYELVKGTTFMRTGLTAASTTVTAKYRVSANTGTFRYRDLWVMTW